MSRYRRKTPPKRVIQIVTKACKEWELVAIELRDRAKQD